jgi:integrase
VARARRPRLAVDDPTDRRADHVEAAAWLLTPAYLLGVLVLDATGARIGELEAARVGDLDENRKAWLVRAKIAKTRKARWVELPEGLFAIVVDRLPAREDRDLGAPLFPIGNADRLRMAVGRACRDAGVPSWSPHDLRHRRISLLHHQGVSWAEIGAGVGQRNLSVTADRYTHVLMDHRELDRGKLLERVRRGQTSGHTPKLENGSLAGKF